MLPKYHIFYGFIFSVIAFWLFKEVGLLGFFIIFLSSFLIDADHVLTYCWIKKDWNPIKAPFRAYKWYMKRDKEFMKLSREKQIEKQLSKLN